MGPVGTSECVRVEEDVGEGLESVDVCVCVPRKKILIAPDNGARTDGKRGITPDYSLAGKTYCPLPRSILIDFPTYR